MEENTEQRIDLTLFSEKIQGLKERIAGSSENVAGPSHGPVD